MSVRLFSISACESNGNVFISWMPTFQVFQQQPRGFVPITSYQNDVNYDGSYTYSYISADGSQQQARGFVKNLGQKDIEAQVVQGNDSSKLTAFTVAKNAKQQQWLTLFFTSKVHTRIHHQRAHPSPSHTSPMKTVRSFFSPSNWACAINYDNWSVHLLRLIRYRLSRWRCTFTNTATNTRSDRKVTAVHQKCAAATDRLQSKPIQSESTKLLQ